MVVQLSCDNHMILDGCSISEAGEGYSDWGFDHGLGCNRDRPRDPVGVIGTIHVASGVLNEVSGVNLTMGVDVNGLDSALGMDRDSTAPPLKVLSPWVPHYSPEHILWLAVPMVHALL